MSSDNARTIQSGAVARRVAFDRYLRTGEAWSAATIDALADRYERKFNPNHDPADGRFTSGPGGPNTSRPKGDPNDPARKAPYYRGRTADGVGPILPTSGGHVDPSGRYAPEMFPPDPYAIKDPVSALGHYMEGSGEPMNFYMNGIDDSQIDITKFSQINGLLTSRVPGSYELLDVPGSIETGKNFFPRHSTEAAVIGGLSASANGTLDVGRDSYRFSGWISASNETYDFHPREGRTSFGDISNSIGEMLPGRKFRVYMVGTKQVDLSGRLPHAGR